VSIWKLGNVLTDGLDSMLNSFQQTQFGNLKADMPKECVPCEWLQKCQGGCTKDRIRDSHDKGSNHFCKSYKMLFAHADEKLGALAVQWKQNQQR
jgi:uncharacterized protein